MPMRAFVVAYRALYRRYRCAPSPRAQGFADVAKTGGPVKRSPSIDQVQALFAEARLLLQDAEDSKGTVYFSDDFEDAKKGVSDTLDAYHRLLEHTELPDARDAIKSANDPKFRQLAEEFAVLEEQLINDED